MGNRHLKLRKLKAPCQGNATVVRDFDLRDSVKQFSTAAGLLTKDGTKYISFSSGIVRVWNSADGSLIREFSVGGSEGGRDSLGFVDISDDASVILLPISGNNGLYVYATFDLNTGNKLASFDSTCYAYLSPDGSKVLKTAFAYNNNHQIYGWTPGLYSATDGSEIKIYPTLLSEKIGLIVRMTDFLANNKFGVFCEQDDVLGAIHFIVLSLNDGSEVARYDEKSGLICGLSPDGSVVAVYNWQLGSISFHTITDGSKFLTIPYAAGRIFNFPHLAITQDNIRFALQLIDNKEFMAPSIYGLNNGMLLKKLAAPTSNTEFLSFSFSADAKKLSGLYRDAASRRYKVRIWEQ